jgi:hypothetical protein
MGNLKKIVSLHEASQISGYHQDYLSALIRKGEIKGQKIGHGWLTTEDEIERYIFKQKIRNKNWIVKYLLCFTRANSSLIYAFILLIMLSAGMYFYSKQYSVMKTQAANTEFSYTNTLAKEEFKQLKF